MPDQEQTLAPVVIENEPSPPIRRPQIGERVLIVHALGHHIPAIIDRVRPDGAVDVTLTETNLGQRIASSPFDPSGKKPDSWHFA